MTKEEKEPNIYQRLHAVMDEVKYVQKEDKKVNNQYSFVSHDAVTAAIRPSLIKHRVIAIPQEIVCKQSTNRTEVLLNVTFINIDNPDDRISVPSVGYGIDQQDKGPGKAISYAVKYALLKGLSLETGDDPERDLIEYKPEKPKASKGIGTEGMKRTGNKAIDSYVGDLLRGINDCVNKEDATKLGIRAWNDAKDSGATEDQLAIIQQQVENHCEYLSSRNGAIR